jgi:hypothetical protein
MFTSLLIDKSFQRKDYTTGAVKCALDIFRDDGKNSLSKEVIMKLLYVVAGNTEVNSNKMCDLLLNKLPSTTFPGCWDMNPSEVTEEVKENVLSCVSKVINNLINSTEYENIIFSWGVNGQSVINELLSRIEINICDIKITNYNDIEKLINEHII